MKYVYIAVTKEQLVGAPLLFASLQSALELLETDKCDCRMLCGRIFEAEGLRPTEHYFRTLGAA